jgi:hypothetical protein
MERKREEGDRGRQGKGKRSNMFSIASVPTSPIFE